MLADRERPGQDHDRLWIERDRTSAGYPIMVPVVDLVEIGNGGGSIAWVDDYAKLHVGPQSAGAAPGPAAYGRGGTEATTTDANLWLGRINKDYFCGGSVDADMDAAHLAIRAVGEKLGVDTDEAARGIVRIANNNMVNALKLVSLNRGFDPRDFTLVAFGGGGAMHAVALAQELGVKKVVVPAGAAVFSAWGMMMSDLRRDFFVTSLADLKPDSAASIEALFTETEALAKSQFAGRRVEPSRSSSCVSASSATRTRNTTTEVLLGDGDVHRRPHRGDRGLVPRAPTSVEYTYRLDAPVELVSLLRGIQECLS